MVCDGQGSGGSSDIPWILRARVHIFQPLWFVLGGPKLHKKQSRFMRSSHQVLVDVDSDARMQGFPLSKSMIVGERAKPIFQPLSFLTLVHDSRALAQA